MNEFQALILGLVQGLTEFLPVSSSGHLELGHAILGVENDNNLLFAVVVHFATVLSTIVVFRKDIAALLAGVFKFTWNDQSKYVAKLLFSAVPVLIVGLFFKDQVEQLFDGWLVFVGCMLILTALLLAFANFSKPGEGQISFKHAFIIGIAQAIAVLPGLSRSGATIATGLILKNNKSGIARFSFLMVLIPIIGAFSLDILKGGLSESEVNLMPLLIGFISAFISGLLACSWMIKIVRNGKLIYFAIYCFVIGLIAIFAA